MPDLAHTPRFSPTDAARFALDLYGISGKTSPLPSERDQNFLLDGADASGRAHRYVFKIANAEEDRSFLEAQNEAMECIADRAKLGPKVLRALDGSTISTVKSSDGTPYLARLISHIAGRPAGEVLHQTVEYRRDLGRAIAAIEHALVGFDHPSLHRAFHWDLAQGVATCRQHLPLVTDVAMRACVERVLGDFEKYVSPVLQWLPTGAIHGDANDFNVIVREDGNLYERWQRVSGVVDYGDMVHSFLVADLAIAAAYAALGQRDPLRAVCDVVHGFHAERALTDSELTAVHGMVCLRMATSVCMAAHQLAQRPGDAYLAISQSAIAKTLPVLARTHSRLALAAYRRACRLEAVEAAPEIHAFIRKHATTFAPILGIPMHAKSCMHVSLAVDSPLVSGQAVENSEPMLTHRVFHAMANAGATVGFGGYAEARMVYTADAFAEPNALPGERRTVHLGIDLFAMAGTPVHAPVAGKVHAFARIEKPLDYGPVIVLEHETDGGTPFYTLYGHLSVESLHGLHVGKPIAAGEQFAAFGTPDVNGGWTPHLHFQLMTDLLDMSTDWPGVATPSHSEFWLSVCLDPTIMSGIPSEAIPQPSPSRAQTLQSRRERLGGNLSIAYRDPVKIVRGSGQYLFDETGRRYIDAYNNVPHVGHAHPRIVAAMHTQQSMLNTNTRYLHDAVNQFADELCATLPESLCVCYFVNSGSEANELALRLARAHTRQRDMIVLEAAYHGNSTTLIDISPYKHAGPGGEGAPSWVHAVPIPDVYRGEFRADNTDNAVLGSKYAAHVRDTIAAVQSNDGEICAYIAESLPSVGGQIVFPSGYLSAVYEHVRSAGGVCIADEVQTGYGRIGTHFWGFQSQNVTPDIVVLGKPIGNGYPLGAVVTTREIAASFDNGMEYFSTFGGSTVSSVVGREVLRTVQDESLQLHAFKVGTHMLEQLNAIKARHAIVGDVRGSGLFLGVELVRDRVTREPADSEASYVSNRMRDEGILLGTDGPFHNVVKIRPPMPFSVHDADVLTNLLEQIVGELRLR